MALKDLCEVIDRTSEILAEHGIKMPLVLENDFFTITGKELIMKIPLTMTLTIPKESLGSDDAISQAISQVVNRRK